MFFKKNKKVIQDAQDKINLAKKIQSKLPEDFVKNEQENKTAQASNRYKINRTIEEECDANIEHYINHNDKIYKFCLILVVLNFIIMSINPIILLIRPDTRFFASSPDGKTWELNTRKHPEGDFVIKEYKGR